MSEMFYQNFIDIDRWNAAGWIAVAFIIDVTYQRAPVMAIVFENGEIGKQIFSGLIDRVGEVDEFEELRIAIVEGDIPGQDPGYSVQLGSDPMATMRRAEAMGEVLEADMFVVGSRIHRMNPAADSRNLPMFKDAFYRKAAYILAPASLEDGNLVADFELGIVKKSIHFRHVDELSDDDLDALVMHTPDDT